MLKTRTAGAKHWIPSLSYPKSQEQEYDPIVLMQVAWASQSFRPFSHSFMSVQLKPLPKKPELHSQSNPSSAF